MPKTLQVENWDPVQMYVELKLQLTPTTACIVAGMVHASSQIHPPTIF